VQSQLVDTLHDVQIDPAPWPTPIAPLRNLDDKTSGGQALASAAVVGRFLCCRTDR
jgi:hypothetical protein